MKHLRGVVALSISVLLVAACHEIPQDAHKSFAGPSETKPYAGPKFKGDKAAYEKAMAERADTQDEYLRTGGAKQ
jgi:hypothetical protein